jgi:hypothetical protein
MKKNLLILMTLMLWASPVVAQQTGGATSPAPAPERLEVLEVEAILGYWSVTSGGNPRAARYDYLKSSVAGGLNVEWDPLPHRFLFESFAVNRKDYFGSMDYAYRDVVVFNVYARGLYHNLNHVSLGVDDPLTASPSFVDRNPGVEYAVESTLRKAFLRLKTPDFPLHVYVEAQTFDRAGTIQQRFMLDPGSANKVSQSREIDWHTQEVKVGINSHLGFLEADLSHTEKTFTARKDKTLFDTLPATTVSFPHNITPDLSGSTDTIKVHTTYSGRFVASGTYSGGDRKNDLYNGTRTDFKNLAGDITYTPIQYLVFVLKYRQFELDAENSATSTAPNTSGTANVYNVRDALSSKRDVLTGLVKYRMTPRLTFKAEYSVDTTEREKFFGNAATALQILPVTAGVLDNSWDVARSTTKTTTKAGLTYRFAYNFFLRTDYSAARVDGPAYATDADKIDSLKASATWRPFQWLSTLVSYGGIREERSNMSAPLAGGSRKTNRDQALGSLTFQLGKRSAVTVSYAQYQNKNTETLTYQMSDPNLPPLVTEDGVLISTDSHVTSVGWTLGLNDRLHLSAEGSRCRSKDKFRNKASVTNTQNDVLADTSIIEDVAAVGVEMQLARNLSIDGRYQYTKFDDETDDTQDGWVKTLMGTLSLKW